MPLLIHCRVPSSKAFMAEVCSGLLGLLVVHVEVGCHSSSDHQPHWLCGSAVAQG